MFNCLTFCHRVSQDGMFPPLNHPPRCVVLGPAVPLGQLVQGPHVPLGQLVPRVRGYRVAILSSVAILSTKTNVNFYIQAPLKHFEPSTDKYGHRYLDYIRCVPGMSGIVSYSQTLFWCESGCTRLIQAFDTT